MLDPERPDEKRYDSDQMIREIDIAKMRSRAVRFDHLHVLWAVCPGRFGSSLAL